MLITANYNTVVPKNNPLLSHRDVLKEYMQTTDSATHKSHKKPSIQNHGIILEL